MGLELTNNLIGMAVPSLGLGTLTPQNSASNLQNELNSIAIAANALSTPYGLPWQGTKNGNGQPAVISPFFTGFVPNPNLWDKMSYYRLLVIDTTTGSIVGGGPPDTISIYQLGQGTLAFTPQTSAWEFRLPITPQQLSITDTYSINTSATLRGILEEHSGVRFKNITIQGTMGVWPGRESIAQPPGTPNILQSVFGGTIASAQNVATQFQSIINNITSGSNASKPVNLRPDNTNPAEVITSASDPEYGGYGTGYFQTMVLTQFLEQYAEAKRNPANASWRLVFDIPKQNQSFVVTPVGFTWNQNVNRPMEINYNLQMKAWRRINLQQLFVEEPLQVTQLTPGILQKILNTIQAAQNTAAAATNLIGAVRSDVDNILNIIRQTGLLVKGIAGVAIAANDLPGELVTDAQSTISQFLSTVQISNLTGAAATNAPTITAIGLIAAAAVISEGLSQQNVATGQLGPASASAAVLNPSNAVFKAPLQYPLLFAQVPVSSLTLNSAQQNALQTELNTVNDFTVANLKTMRGTILTLCVQLSNLFGAGNAYYDTLFNQPPPLVRVEPMNLDEFDILADLYSLLEAYDQLTATNILDNDQILNNMEYVNALAATSDIEFEIPNSQIQVPVPYGLNMEQIAQRYLGDYQRWLEIVTLNELREPYVDENGFRYTLLSNAYGRNIIIGSIGDLFLGQTVYLNSTTQSSTARNIINIETLSSTSFLLTLDGLANLDSFTAADQAYIQAYLPATVNSQNVIWIPNNQIAPPYDQISIPASVANVDLVGLSKVDWLLSNQDIAVTNTGDFRLAAGIPNLIQALAIKFGTQAGTSLLNPDFGLSFKVGTMNSDVTAQNIYSQISQLITADPRFQGISGLQVTLNGPSLGINLGVQLAGKTGLFPVGFQFSTYST